MKILYLTHADLDDNSGVSNKVLQQCTEWSKQKQDITILSLFSCSFFSLDGVRLSEKKLFYKPGIIEAAKRLKQESIVLHNLLNDCEYDIIYMRYRLYNPFLEKIFKGKPLIVELNSVDVTETKLNSKIRYLYNKFLRHKFLKHVNGFISVSHEIDQKVKTVSTSSIILANGINVAAYSFIKKTKTTRPTLVFIGSSGQSWHGIDKIVYMAKKLTKFDFHILGEIGENTENLFFHGKVSLNEGNSIISQCDVGLCTLALYRKEMIEASPLKSRQYLVHGLPIIYAYNDTDIQKKYEFVLKLDNDENNVKDNINMIEEFVERAFKNIHLREQAHTFARKYLDVSIKEKRRIAFLKEIYEKNNKI